MRADQAPRLGASASSSRERLRSYLVSSAASRAAPAAATAGTAPQGLDEAGELRVGPRSSAPAAARRRDGPLMSPASSAARRRAARGRAASRRPTPCGACCRPRRRTAARAAPSPPRRPRRPPRTRWAAASSGVATRRFRRSRHRRVREQQRERALGQHLVAGARRPPRRAGQADLDGGAPASMAANSAARSVRPPGCGLARRLTAVPPAGRSVSALCRRARLRSTSGGWRTSCCGATRSCARRVHFVGCERLRSSRDEIACAGRLVLLAVVTRRAAAARHQNARHADHGCADARACVARGRRRRRRRARRCTN